MIAQARPTRAKLFPLPEQPERQAGIPPNCPIEGCGERMDDYGVTGGADACRMWLCHSRKHLGVAGFRRPG